MPDKPHDPRQNTPLEPQVCPLPETIRALDLCFYLGVMLANLQAGDPMSGAHTPPTVFLFTP